jgi:hypothetical protein
MAWKGKTMAKDGKLLLELLDVYNHRLEENVDIELNSMNLSDRQLIRQAPASKCLNIQNLYSTPQGQYRIEVDPPSYQIVSQFVNISARGTTSLKITFPVDPRKIMSVSFPSSGRLIGDLKTLLSNSSNVLLFEGSTGPALYDALDDRRKAGLLNIAIKTSATKFANQRSVLSYVKELIEIRGDRFFARVPKELREETKNSVPSKLFHVADELLHHPPLANFTPAGSFKTNDHYGNLQLTFFMNGNDCVADIDIDDAAGIEHIYQVLRNAITGQPTDPYDIHEILVGFQNLDPGYKFNLYS